MTVPVLFVQGARDEMCPLEHLAEVRGRMQAPNELHVLEGGDHSLEVAPKAQKAADQRILEAVTAFLSR